MTETRNLIADGIERLLSENIDRPLLEQAEAGRWPYALWNLLENGGYTQVLAQEGASANWSEGTPVLKAAGYHRVPLPLAETLVAGWLLARAGLATNLIGPVTLIQATDNLRSARDGAYVSLTGTASRVPWARFAKYFVVACNASDGPILALFSANDGIRITPGSNVAGEPRDLVTFEATRGTSVPQTTPEDDPVVLYGALARATALAGTIESVLDQALQYANDRIQFGRPIGKFQAVQHLLADLACEAVAANAAVDAACEAVGSPSARMEIAAAKVRAGDAAERAAAIAHQVHGAIGFTYEHTLHFGTRRLWAWRSEFRSGAQWARELGAHAIQRSAGRFWPDITAGGMSRTSPSIEA